MSLRLIFLLHWFLLSWMLGSAVFCFAQDAPVGVPEASSPQTREARGFVSRFAQFYLQDWRGTAGAGPARVAISAAYTAFPNADWSYGGALREQGRDDQ